MVDMQNEKTFQHGKYDINYIDVGSGMPILLIHGLAGDHHAWDRQIEAWSKSYRIIAPDSRGAGKSTQLDEPVTLQHLADEYLLLMSHLGIDVFHVVGRSMGGCIAQLMALSEPSRIASMVWMSSCGRFDSLGLRRLDCHREVLERSRSWETWSKHAINDFISDNYFIDHQEEARHIEKLIAGTDRLPECYMHQSDAVVQHNVLPKLKEIKCPILVLSGAEDRLCGPVATRWMVDAVGNCVWVEFSGGHFFFLEEAGKFMRVTEDWFRDQAESLEESDTFQAVRASAG